MTLLNLFDEAYVYISLISGGLGGLAVNLLTHRVINRRGVFTYWVNHSKVGNSVDHPEFGKITVSWNDSPQENIFLSTMQMKNSSLNDYENLIIKTSSQNTTLMSEQTRILDSINKFNLSDRFKSEILGFGEEGPSAYQREVYFSSREYMVPVLNRGQTIEIAYLNFPSNSTGPGPVLTLSVEQKGVRTVYRLPDREIFGVSQKLAAICGVFLGLLLLVLTGFFNEGFFPVALVAMAYGLVAQFPGVLVVKGFRWVRNLIGG